MSIFARLIGLLALPLFFLLRLYAALRELPTRQVVFYGSLGLPLRFALIQFTRRHHYFHWINFIDYVPHLIVGNVGLTGPRIRLIRQGVARPAYGSYATSPGFISPYWLQHRAGLVLESENASDIRLIKGSVSSAEMRLLTRWLLGSFVAARSINSRAAPATVELCRTRVDNCTMDEALDRIVVMARGPGATQAAFVNPDCLNKAWSDQTYARTLESISLVMADGIGLRLATKWFTPWRLRGNVNGTDMFPQLCARAAREDLPVFFLGAAEGIASEVARQAKARNPNLKIAGTHHGFWNANEIDALLASIDASGARIVLVAMGAPRQEIWIDQHLSRLSPGVFIGVGGLFDFFAGRVRRAPPWLRELGMEWAFRLAMEPGRMWRRYVIGNPLFLWRAWRSAVAARASLADANSDVKNS